MRVMIAASIMCLTASTLPTSPAASRLRPVAVGGYSINTDISAARRQHHYRHHRRQYHSDPVKVIAARQESIIDAQRAAVSRLRTEMYNIKRELDSFRTRIGPSVPLASVFAPQQALAVYGAPLPFPDVREPEVIAPPQEPINPVTASLPVVTEAPAIPKLPHPIQGHHVFPCTCTQRGQWGDRRKTHRHAGIDMGGENGSRIVAAIGGRVLPAPGGDRGYGPHALVVKGSDGFVYRYAHLSTVAVKVGQNVATGQTLGTMGKHHLHFERYRWVVYSRGSEHAYYFKNSIDPNTVLHGERGTHVTAGEPMSGSVQTAELSAPEESVKVVRKHRHKRVRSAKR